jgi:hypothetical protein
MVDAVSCGVKVQGPDPLRLTLETIEPLARLCVDRMLEHRPWSFCQLLQFLLYKAALRGVMVIGANPAYSSQECSRCPLVTEPNGKSFRGPHCGHQDHRDANAAFTLALRVSPIGAAARESERPRSAVWTQPFLGTEAPQCA